MFTFLLMTNSSVTVSCSVCYQYFRFFVWTLFLNILVTIVHINPVLNLNALSQHFCIFQLTVDILIHTDPLNINEIYQCLVDGLLDCAMYFFLILELPIINILYEWSGIWIHSGLCFLYLLSSVTSSHSIIFYIVLLDYCI